MNLRSDGVKVFPSAFRNDNFDRHARLNSEYNITSLVNRLTGRDAFIIGDGLIYNSDSNKLTAGQLNMLGYYFNITREIELNEIMPSTTSANPPSNGDIVAFTISIKGFKANNDDSFDQLDGFDSSTSDDSVYSGLSVEYIATSGTHPILHPYTTIEDGNKIVTLPILLYNTSTGWSSINESRLSYTAKQLAITNVKVSAIDNSKTEVMKNAGLSNDGTIENVALDTWLVNNFIIDDGEI